MADFGSIPKHFKAPLNPYGGMLLDANGKMMLSRIGGKWVARGWGHIQYKNNGALIMDNWNGWVAFHIDDKMSLPDVVSIVAAGMDGGQ